MQITPPEFVKQLLNTFHQQGFEIYIVGGAVRDILLERPVKDWDFTTNATPQQIVSLFQHTFYDNDFGTVGIVSPQDHKAHQLGKLQAVPIYEVTTFRTEHGYSDNRRPDKVEWGTSLEQDLQRRDFTISAIALKPQIDAQQRVTDYQVIDPFNGQQDLKQRVIKAVGDPHQRFQEDALRMLRAIRIAAQLGFTIDQATLEAIQANAPTITKIAFERIREEIFKILTTEFAYDAVNILASVNLLEYLLPELLDCRGVEQAGHHTLDVWEHSLQSMQNCPSSDPLVKFATLLHDIGKPVTRAFICQKCKRTFRLESPFGTRSTDKVVCAHCQFENPYRASVIFHNHEMAGAKIASRIADRFRLSNKHKIRLKTLVRWHMFSVDERQTEKAIRRFIRNVGKENLDDILDLRIGDRLGGGAKETSWRLERFKRLLIEVQKQPFTVHDLKITGHQIMEVTGLLPGPQIGLLLKQLYQEVVDHQLPNEADSLSHRLTQIISKTPIPTN